MHLRIDRGLDAQLRRQVAEAHVPTSALVRRLLRQAAVQEPREQVTTADVESIARRVAREELHPRVKPPGQRGTGLSLAAKSAANYANFCTSRRTASDVIMGLSCRYAQRWIPTDTACRP